MENPSVSPTLSLQLKEAQRAITELKQTQKQLREALENLYDAMESGASLERHYCGDIDRLWDAAESILEDTK